jgi:hypothetical protein
VSSTDAKIDANKKDGKDDTPSFTCCSRVDGPSVIFLILVSFYNMLFVGAIYGKREG